MAEKTILLTEADLEKILDRHSDQVLEKAEQRFYANIGKKIVQLALGLLGAIAAGVYVTLKKV
jgi:hypothetical protein